MSFMQTAHKIYKFSYKLNLGGAIALPAPPVDPPWYIWLYVLYSFAGYKLLLIYINFSFLFPF